MSGDATLLEADGRWTLRFERRFAHPIEKVWRGVVDPGHRDAWFPQRIVGDLVAGGELQFVDDPNLPAEGFAGRCIEIQPPNLLVLEWGEDTVRIELTADGEGTRLVFLDTVADRAHAARTAGGWHQCIDALEATLEGRAAPTLDETTWNELHDAYLATMGGERHVWGQLPT